MNTYDFNERVESQKEYFEKFKHWLMRQESMLNVREAGIEDDLKGTDLFLETQINKIYRVQVKVDHLADRTGNIPIEVISQAYSNRNSVIGSCFNMSDVEYLFFILSHSKTVYGYNFRNLLEYVINNYSKFRNFSANNKMYKTLGVLVPIKEINQFVSYKGVL